MLVNYNEAAMQAALQIGLSGWSFSQSQDGGKITVKNLAVQDVTIENGITTVSPEGEHPLSEDDRVPAVLGERDDRVQRAAAVERATSSKAQLNSASIKLANPDVKEVNLSNVPNWLDNSSEVQNFLENKLAQQPAIPVTGLLQTFIASGGSLGPTIAA